MVERDNLSTIIQNNDQTKQAELNEVADRWRTKIKKVVDDTKAKLKEAKDTRARVVELETELEALKAQLGQANRSFEELNIARQQKAVVEEQLAAAQKQVDIQRSNAVNFHREAVCK